MPTIAERWIEEGLERGREEGRQEGRQEGRRDGLLNGLAVALELRFGENGLQLLPEIRERADVAALEALMDAVKRASSPEDLRRLYGGN